MNIERKAFYSAVYQRLEKSTRLGMTNEAPAKAEAS